MQYIIFVTNIMLICSGWCDVSKFMLVHHDVILRQQLLETKTVKSFVECALCCLQSANCISVNLRKHEDSLACELLDAYDTGGQLVVEAGSAHASKFN